MTNYKGIHRTALTLWAALFVLFMAAGYAPDASAYSVKQIWARFSATAGETLSTGDVVVIKSADGYAWKANAASGSLRPAVGVVGKSGTAGSTVEIIVNGIVTGWTSLSKGSPGYVSGTTAGAITQSSPAYSQQVGYAINATDYVINCRSYFDTTSLTALGTLTGATPLVLEGATADAFQTTIAVTDPTAARTFTLPDASGVPVLSAGVPEAATSVWGTANGFVFEGATANAFETTLTVTDPTADRTFTLPDGSGTAMVSSLATNAPDVADSVWGASNGLVFEGATADAYETTITPTDPTADRTVTIPDASGTVSLNCTATHNYAGAAADWTMTAAEAACSFVTVSNANGAVKAILPAAQAGKLWFVSNGSGQTLTFQVTGQTGATLATSKVGLYAGTAADVFEIYEQP